MRKYFLFLLFFLSSQFYVVAQDFEKEIINNVGEMLWHSTKSLTFNFTNETSSNQKIIRVEELSPDLKVNFDASSVQPGASFELFIKLESTTLGRFHKRILVYLENRKQPIIVGLSGEVISLQHSYNGSYAVEIEGIKFSLDHIDFNSVSKGERPQKIIYIKNESKEIYTPSLMQLPSYIEFLALPEKIAPGHKGCVLLTLNSDAMNNYGLTQTSVYFSRHLGEELDESHKIPITITLHAPIEKFNAIKRANAPRMVLDKSIVNCTDISHKSSVKDKVIISNQGKSALQISSVQVLHPAINISLEKSIIAPGESTELSVKLLKKYINRFNGKLRILLTTNDWRSPEFFIELRDK